MPLLPPEGSAVSPLLTAGLLFAAIPLLAELGLDHPSVAAVVAATGASRSRAYELRAAILAALPSFLRPVGRPKAAEPVAVDAGPVQRALLDFVYDHPGSVGGSGARRRYSDAFRRFVLELVAEHKEIPLPAFAGAIRVPLATLQDWLSGGVVAAVPEKSLTAVPSGDPTEPQIETILAEWKRWEGSFTAFCKHVQHDERIPFGRTLISEILAACGVRFAKRRRGRSPDEDAVRGQFETFFPDAQWVGDGSPIDITVGNTVFTFNVELMVDPCSGAVTGLSIRDQEDAAAVVEAFADSVRTTGEPPLAVLLDNKPSNHADAVKAALAPTDVMRATPFRPQNKAHVEGAYGLFQQVAPALVIALRTPYEIAKQVLELVMTVWGRVLNHKPRKDRGGRSRVELHLGHRPTPEEVLQAKSALADRMRKQELARQTLAARQDPVVRLLLSEAFSRLEFLDPQGELLNAIARYPLDAVADGIAVVEGKRHAGTLPKTADARYLLGVVRNLAQEREGWEIAQALWASRRRARDLALQAVERDRDQIAEDVDQVERRVAVYVDRALAASRKLDRFFWLQAVADAALEEDPSAHEPLFRLAARRIHATHAVPHAERLSATRFLANRVLTLAP